MRRLPAIQSAIRAEGLDGWLLYDFKGLNPIALRVAGIPADRFISRRWACFIPAAGEPRWIAHAIEAGGLRDLAPGIATYISWQSWREGLAALLTGAGRVAMEVSPGCAIPYISRVDAGTIELVRSLGVEVATSADLVQVAEAVWTADQLASHRRACTALNAIKDAAYAHVRDRLGAGLPVTECGVQDFMMTQFAVHALETDHPPIVAVNAHAADPHFARAATPTRHSGRAISCCWIYGAASHTRTPSTAISLGWATPVRRSRRASKKCSRSSDGRETRPWPSPENASAPGRRFTVMKWTMRAVQ